ncbi:MAG: hypothetical protein NC820_02520 [Candidatus Omnitrophica bacterium]|nr:hypothetical protein [Candidatus Omnitrophota bacterium]
MDKENIKRCKRCALPETYPGVKFSEEGICNYCFYYDIYKERERSIKIQLKKEFLSLINSLKRGKKYDCVVAYSGGKDSTFLLYFLKNKFKLNILAHTLDNGFLSPRAMSNIEVIVKRLYYTYLYKDTASVISKDIKVRSIFSFALSKRTFIYDE